MPEIITIRVVRSRKVQPEQFGSAGAEVELTGNVLEGEDYRTVARKMLADSRALVYENLGMQLPAAAKSALEDLAALDGADPSATVETTAAEPAKEPAKKPRGRPKGSTNTKPKAGSKAAKEAEAAHQAQIDAAKAAEVEEDVPGIGNDPAKDEPAKDEPAKEEAAPVAEEDVPGISTGEARVNPEDETGDHGEDVPSNAPSAETSKQPDGAAKSAEPAPSAEGEDGDSSKQLQQDVCAACEEGKITLQQGKQIQAAFKVPRFRDLTAEQLPKARKMFQDMLDMKALSE